jgi:hypothetical protein
MTDTTNKFDHIHRLQQIATTIREVGGIADIFDSPATSAYDIECAIKEIERLHRDYSCICSEMRRMMDERDEARRSCCEYAAIVDGADTADGMESGRFYERAMKYMKDRGWDCFKEDGKPCQ